MAQHTLETPTGTLYFPPEPRAPIPTEHCELCATVFGKATCQQSQYKRMWLVRQSDADGTVYYIVSPYIDGATVVSLLVLAQVEESRLRQAQDAIVHAVPDETRKLIPF